MRKITNEDIREIWQYSVVFGSAYVSEHLREKRDPKDFIKNAPVYHCYTEKTGTFFISAPFKIHEHLNLFRISKEQAFEEIGIVLMEEAIEKGSVMMGDKGAKRIVQLRKKKLIEKRLEKIK